MFFVSSCLFFSNNEERIPAILGTLKIRKKTQNQNKGIISFEFKPNCKIAPHKKNNENKV